MSDSIMGAAQMNVSQMVGLLSQSYSTLINSRTPLKTFPSVMLWGAPGVGKSQGVRQIAEQIYRITGKDVSVTDVRLLLFNPVDLRGIPTANEDKTLAVWLKPKIFQMDPSEEVVNILFLDEISAAPQSVQAAAYQITLDRTVGEHKLPDNCIVIAAGNRMSDRSVAYTMPKALANRMCHIEIVISCEAWHDWAVAHRVHPFVVGYLEYNPVALMRFDSANDGVAFPTPRSWEMVSNILNNISSDMRAISPLIVGCIGPSTTSSLKTWISLYYQMPSMETIFSGKCTEIPKAPELMVALCSAMVRYATMHPTKEKIDKSITYACKLPWSFRCKLLHDYSLIPELHEIIKDNQVFIDARKNGWQ